MPWAEVTPSRPPRRCSTIRPIPLTAEIVVRRPRRSSNASNRLRKWLRTHPLHPPASAVAIAAGRRFEHIRVGKIKGSANVLAAGCVLALALPGARAAVLW